MKKTKIDAYSLLEKVRTLKPVVHHLTNWVTIYDCANIVKVFGGSPVMAHALEEAAEMTQISSAVVLNIGTLTSDLVEAMRLSGRAANLKQTPVILDVCGVGATQFRDRKALELLKEVRIDVIKGNASEIARLAGETIRTKGVDSVKVSKDLAFLSQRLAKRYKCSVVVTGKVDYIADESHCLLVQNGHSMMENVVGTGCMAASVIGTFCAVEKDLCFASAAGLAAYEIAAQQAVKLSKGPGSFKEKLFDCIFKLDKKAINKMQKVERIDFDKVSSNANN
jgi:hydroxyethylthiazole kinase